MLLPEAQRAWATFLAVPVAQERWKREATRSAGKGGRHRVALRDQRRAVLGAAGPEALRAALRPPHQPSLLRPFAPDAPLLSGPLSSPKAPGCWAVRGPPHPWSQLSTGGGRHLLRRRAGTHRARATPGVGGGRPPPAHAPHRPSPPLPGRAAVGREAPPRPRPVRAPPPPAGDKRSGGGALTSRRVNFKPGQDGGEGRGAARGSGPPAARPGR